MTNYIYKSVCMHTVLLATHDLFRARQVADRIGILRRGEKRAELPGQSLDGVQLEALYLQHMEA